MCLFFKHQLVRRLYVFCLKSISCRCRTPVPVWHIMVRFVPSQLRRHGRTEPAQGHSRFPASPLRCDPVWGHGVLDRLEHTCRGEGPQVHWCWSSRHWQQHAPAVRHSRVPPLPAATQYEHLCLSISRLINRVIISTFILYIKGSYHNYLAVCHMHNQYSFFIWSDLCL